MIEKLLQTSERVDRRGEAIFRDHGTTTFVVPPGVTEIAAVVVGSGTSTTYSRPGGGGLSWRNHIPVTPGESLTITITTQSSIKRGSTVLVLAYGSANGSAGGKGGKAAHAINDGGGNGGGLVNIPMG